ncbi:MAG: hypothetical protein SOS93_02055 [Mannheimia varigena]|nr:hypothetical protein [Mannheimia varigena]
MVKHLRYTLFAMIFVFTLALLYQCSDGEEIVPTGNCKPEKCEFKVTEHIKLGKS